MSKKLRFATQSDIPALVEFGRQMALDAEYPAAMFDPEFFANVLKVAINSTPQQALVLVAEQDGELVGFCGGHLVPYIFANRFYGELMLLYVSPKKRGSWLAIAMVRTFMRWAQSKGAVEFKTHMGGLKGRSYAAFCARLGLKPNGAEWGVMYG